MSIARRSVTPAMLRRRPVFTTLNQHVPLAAASVLVVSVVDVLDVFLLSKVSERSLLLSDNMAAAMSCDSLPVITDSGVVYRRRGRVSRQDSRRCLTAKQVCRCEVERNSGISGSFVSSRTEGGETGTWFQFPYGGSFGRFGLHSLMSLRTS